MNKTERAIAVLFTKTPYLTGRSTRVQTDKNRRYILRKRTSNPKIPGRVYIKSPTLIQLRRRQ